MNLLRRALNLVSDEAQYAASVFLARTGLMSQMPAFRSAIQMLEYSGGDRREIKYALAHAHDYGPSFSESWVELAERLNSKARLAMRQENHELARRLYYHSALYYLVANWPQTDPREIAVNYERALASFDIYRELTEPQILKVTLEGRGGVLKGHYRFPKNASKPLPAIVLFPGDEEPKEAMGCFEEEALKREMAVLTIDPPGFGESHFFGTRLSAMEDVVLTANSALRFLNARPEVDGRRIGMMGLSLGGLFAITAAGQRPEIKAVAAIGAPYDPVDMFHNLTPLQKKKIYRETGAENAHEAEAMLRGLRAPQMMAHVGSPTLIVHGMADELVSVRHARSLVSTLPGQSELKLIPDGDHMVSSQLKGIVPYIFNWMRDRLNHLV